jgi:hypothetical protein
MRYAIILVELSSIASNEHVEDETIVLPKGSIVEVFDTKGGFYDATHPETGQWLLLRGEFKYISPLELLAMEAE